MTTTRLVILLAALVAGFLVRRAYVYFFPRFWRPQTPQRQRRYKARQKKKLLESLSLPGRMPTLGTDRDGMFH